MEFRYPLQSPEHRGACYGLDLLGGACAVLQSVMSSSLGTYGVISSQVLSGRLRMKVGMKHFRRMLYALAFVVAFPAPASVAAEITCVDTYGPGQIDQVRAAEIYSSGRRPAPDTCRKILIKGTILPGDATKFAQVVRRNHPFLNYVLLWSSGGSVEEAIKIGRLIRKGLLETEAPSGEISDRLRGKGWYFSSTIVPGCPERDVHTAPRGPGCHCASACFLIWSAGVERSGTSLGLHRPTIASTAFANLPPNRASVLYRQLLLDIDKYLTEMEVPRRFIDVMMDTTSTEIRWLSYDEAVSVEEVRSIAQWIAATCGAMTKAEKDTMRTIDLEIALKRSVSQRDRMLLEQLEKKSGEINICSAKKLWKARDTISEVTDDR